ncbi:MAG: extracellular solute-binding protein [Rhizobiales bacterium]|nr:extracellular solute-binding protein [Hyphomicrobiales bacterium]NRB14230.1 extracellular solute-binding protein [Hyphomicrobiales bacterium]
MKTYSAIKTTLICLAISVSANGAMASENKLNIYNWSDYIAPDTIANFDALTGIETTYDVFDSNEVLEGKLLGGQTGYDLVVPTASFMEMQIQAGVFMPLDKSKLKNYANLDPEIMQLLAKHDPGNKYAIPYLWGTTGIAYNIDKIKQRMPDAPLDSWDMIFKPEVIAKFADCGVAIIDAPSENFEIAQNYLGLDPHSGAEADMDAAIDLWKSIRPYVRYFHSSQQVDDLATGEICLAIGWSGDMFQALNDAADAGNGVKIDYYIPKEGSTIWFDVFGIPNDAKNIDAAHKFLDYTMDAKIAAANSNEIWYANAIPSSMPMILDEIKNNVSVYPTEKIKANLFIDKPGDAATARARNKAWARLKAGS